MPLKVETKFFVLIELSFSPKISLASLCLIFSPSFFMNSSSIFLTTSASDPSYFFPALSSEIIMLSPLLSSKQFDSKKIPVFEILTSSTTFSFACSIGLSTFNKSSNVTP